MLINQQIAYHEQIDRKLNEQKKQMLVFLRQELGTTNMEPLNQMLITVYHQVKCE